MTDNLDLAATRRGFMTMAAGGAAALAASSQTAQAQTVRSNARIVIMGGGAGGASMANRLVRRLDGARITVIEGRAQHWYQPGFTLIGAGLRKAGYAITNTTDWLPRNIDFIADYVAQIDPVSNSVTTRGGRRIDYDYLIIACGTVQDHAAIEGFDLSLVGPEHGISAHYASPELAERSARAFERFTDEGGVGLFGRPATDLKCAGAPVKMCFLAEDIATRKGRRDRAQYIFNAQTNNLFGLPVVHHRVRQFFEERDIAYRYSHVLKAIDASAKVATFETPDGDVRTDYDFINVVSPQRAPQPIRDAGLSHPERWIDQGWLHVNRETLRHMTYSNIFGVGDIIAVPRGKTAASVKWHLPVVEDHLIAEIQGREGSRTFDGYTSCPLITRVGRALLIEFNFTENLHQSFPGVVSPLDELWVSWAMKVFALKPTYNAMLRGVA